MNNKESVFTRLCGKKRYNDQLLERRIIVWGGGFNGKVVQVYLERMKNIKIHAFCDNDIQKQGAEFNRSLIDNTWIPCISLEAVANLQNCVVIVAIKNNLYKVFEQLNNLHIDYIMENQLAFADNMDKLEELYENLEDGDSKNILLNLIDPDLRETPERYMPIISNEAYFGLSEFLRIGGNEVFIDCGAYVGDTVEKYIWSRDGIFQKIYAFEPGEKQFKTLEIRKKRLCNEWGKNSENISIFNLGVGSESKSLFSHGSGQSMFLSQAETESEINIVALDDMINESVSFIKIDVEGGECSVLNGAERLIKEFKPRIAVAVYHKPWHMWKILNQLQDMRSDYHFKLRHHALDMHETILYAY